MIMTEDEKQVIISEIESNLDAVINFCEKKKKNNNELGTTDYCKGTSYRRL